MTCVWSLAGVVLVLVWSLLLLWPWVHGHVQIVAHVCTSGGPCGVGEEVRIPTACSPIATPSPCGSFPTSHCIPRRPGKLSWALLPAGVHVTPRSSHHPDMPCGRSQHLPPVLSSLLCETSPFPGGGCRTVVNLGPGEGSFPSSLPTHPTPVFCWHWDDM